MVRKLLSLKNLRSGSSAKKRMHWGKEVEVGRRVCKIGAIVSGWSNHSNIPYNILAPARHSPQWGSSNEQLLIRVRERTDIDAFRTKMSTVCINDIEKESELSDLFDYPDVQLCCYSDYVDKADVVILFQLYILFLFGRRTGDYLFVIQLFDAFYQSPFVCATVKWHFVR